MLKSSSWTSRGKSTLFCGYRFFSDTYMCIIAKIKGANIIWAFIDCTWAYEILLQINNEYFPKMFMKCCKSEITKYFAVLKYWGYVIICLNNSNKFQYSTGKLRTKKKMWPRFFKQYDHLRRASFKNRPESKATVYVFFFRILKQVEHTTTVVLWMNEEEMYFWKRQTTSFGYNLQKPYSAYLRGRINYAHFNTCHTFRSVAYLEFGYLQYGCYFVSTTL